MKRHAQFFFLIAMCTLCAAGCRRKPITAETQAQTEAETQSVQQETEAVTEAATEQATEKESETQKQQAKKPTTITANKTQKSTENTDPTATAQACPYCGNQFSTAPNADGSSEYSAHVAQEEAYIESIGGDVSDYQTGSDGTLYAQCPYCFQWFSDAPDASGYSPYAEHVAAETAYANQMANEDYVQCPNCGNWVTQSEYQQHIAYGW